MSRRESAVRPTPAAGKRRAEQETYDDDDEENESQQTSRSAPKSQKTQTITNKRVTHTMEPGVVLMVKLVNFKNHDHLVQACTAMSPPPSLSSVTPPIHHRC